ncbi:DMT family transporter [Paenibacillus nasutitermitis]|uniref:QacE family quaternary ammonium compound efflux SMR transporter n=1 Tax=Paenibacillus nasutitermitis TaxID=1652958 RepID=A0A916Z2Z1_9BACL|nr:multidrug efflux SMR transporter [Paenibacillus nasutitermitis]GGD73571.1 QacE family quaternary ammonium compound efflux SMR transporter [Paenibacillus nasutitermitis]
MAWGAIVLAGVMEIFGVINIKRLTMKKWDALFYLILSFGISFTLLSYAMKTIPMGTAYAVWTGLGTVGATLLGMFMYGEPKEWRRLLFIAMILGSAVGLKLVS